MGEEPDLAVDLDMELDATVDMELDLGPTCEEGLCVRCSEDGVEEAAIDDDACPTFICQSGYLKTTDNVTSDVVGGL